MRDLDGRRVHPQLAVSYVSNRYFFYVVGSVPDGKNPRRVDPKLIERYRVGVSKWRRARRKRAGSANLQYLRHGRLFVLLATHDEHDFFAEEARVVRDVRRVPFKAFGYAVSYNAGYLHARIPRSARHALGAGTCGGRSVWGPRASPARCAAVGPAAAVTRARTLLDSGM